MNREGGKCKIEDNVKYKVSIYTLKSGIDVGQGINVGPGKFGKKNKHRVLN